jgi:hypothetical protein
MERDWYTPRALWQNVVALNALSAEPRLGLVLNLALVPGLLADNVDSANPLKCESSPQESRDLQIGKVELVGFVAKLGQEKLSGAVRLDHHGGSPKLGLCRLTKIHKYSLLLVDGNGSSNWGVM